MSLDQNLSEIRQKIEKACESVGRNSGEVTLVAISKTFSIPQIQAAYDLGLRDFGESRLQEAQPKIEALPNDIRWHFVGSLQSNKAKKVCQLFDKIHTLCTESQLGPIEKANKPIEAFIEVNIAKESQKSGIFPEMLDEYVKKVLNYSHIHLIGLMTIGAAETSEEETRKGFRKLRELNQSIGGTALSMGMSENFDVAIQEGATHIRVGSALFGAR